VQRAPPETAPADIEVWTDAAARTRLETRVTGTQAQRRRGGVECVRAYRDRSPPG
jgi:hypothetical protein